MEIKIELIDGIFSKEETLQLLTNLIQTKIKFHETKISLADALEDIQSREKKIKKLSDTLQQLRKILENKDQFDINGVIEIK